MPNSIKKVDITQIKYKPLDGEIVQDSTSNDYFVWNGGWNKIEINNSGLELDLYDLNKSAMAQFADFDDEDFANAAKTITDFMTGNEYYMLYGKEISYFTVFHLSKDFSNKENPGEVVIECLRTLGSVKAIDLDEENGGLEIWVVNNDNTTCLYLFPYDEGIVNIGL